MARTFTFDTAGIAGMNGQATPGVVSIAGADVTSHASPTPDAPTPQEPSQAPDMMM